MTTIKITALTDIGANIPNTTLIPVVDMTGTPTTDKATFGNVANAILSQAGNNYSAAAKAVTVTASAQPNITSVGTLTELSVTGNVTADFYFGDGGFLSNVTGGSAIPGGSNSQVQYNNAGDFAGDSDFTYDFANNILNITRANASYLTAYESVSTANISANGLATIAHINVTNTANLGAVGNITITGGTNGQVLTTNGTGGLSWTTVSGGGSYSNANVANYLPTYTGNLSGSNLNVPPAVDFNLNTDDGNGNISSWTFTADGDLYWPGPDDHSIYNGASNSFVIHGHNKIIISTDGANANYQYQFYANGDLGLPGNVSATTFSGNGSGLSSIAGANVTGTVGNANLSQYLAVSDVNNNFSYHVVLSAGSGDKSLHIDADDNLQYNPADGTLTATRVDATYVLADLQYSNGYPAANVTGLGNIATANFDGNASNVLHGDGTWSADTTTYGNSNVVTLLSAFGSNTITTTGNVSVGNIIGNGQALTNIAGANVSGFVPNANVANTAFAVAAANVTGLGNIATLNLDGNVSNLLTGNGTYVAIPVVPTVGNIATINLDGNSQTWLAGNGVFANIAIPSVGNIATINLDGSSSNVLYGNGVFAAVAGGANTGNVTFDNINIIGTGNLHLQPDPANISSYLDIFISSGPDLHLVASAAANLILGKDDGPNVMTSWDGNVYVQSWNTGSNTQGGVWNFGEDGLLTLPGNTVQIGSQYGSQAILASNVAFGVVSQGSAGMTALQWTDDVSNTSQFSAVYINDASANVGDIQIRTGAVGNANIWKFGNDGNLTLPSNTFAVNYANGTPVSIGGGGNTGNVTFDNVTVQGVNGLNLSAGSDFTANLAYLQVRAGDVASHIHLDTGNNSAYDLIVGDDQNYVQVSSTGNILLSSYDSNTAQYIWTLDYNGNLILAGGNSVIQSIASSSLDPLNPNVSTMVLTPDPGYSSQALVLDPTSPGHIHLRAPSQSGNIDVPAANIFLGGEDTSFEVTNGANNEARIHSNGKAWTFGNDGNISSDTLTLTTTFANVKTVEYQTAGVWDLYVEDGITGSNTASSRLNVSFKDNLIDKPQVYIENTKESDGIALRWTFDENGNLNFPRDVAGNTDPYLSIFGGSTPTIQSTDVSLAGPANLTIQSNYLNLSGFSGDKIVFYADTGEMATDANMTLTTNLANTGNTSSWVFGTDGNLTIPGTSGGFIKTISNASIGIAAMDNGTNNPAQLLSINAGSGAATSIVSAYSTNATIQTNATGTLNTWQFDNAGNLTLPTGGQIIVSGGLVSSGASPAPTINGFSITNSVGISGNGNIAGNNISATGQITSTQAGNLSDGGGQLYLNGSGNNRIDFNTNGTGAPSFTTRSAGAKVVLYPSIGASATDYAMGVDAGTLWSGIPAADAGQFFKWYGGTTEVANLSGTGMLTVIGNVTGGNIITGGVVSATGNVSGNFFLGNGSQLTGITATSLVNGTSNVVTTNNGNVTIGIAGNAAIATFTGTGANVTGTLDVTGNVTAQGVGTNLVRRANTISGSNTVVTLDNLTALIGGSPTRLYIGAATSNMTMAGTSQTMVSGSMAVSSWINLPVSTGVGNGFAVGGAISSAGDTVVLNITDQGAGSGTWRVTGMIANTSANLYSVSIERLA